MEFSAVTDRYIVLKMPVDRYTGTDRVLKDSLVFAGDEMREKIRKEEKRLLKLNFKVWKVPYYRRLPGWRTDTPIYVLHNNRLVGGVYICDRNQFEEPEWGQLHYCYIAPAYKGKGIYSVMFKEAILKIVSWGLDGLVLNTDRFLHQELYEKWGAAVWKTIDKRRRNIHAFFNK